MNDSYASKAGTLHQKPNPPNGYAIEFQDMQDNQRAQLARRLGELDDARASVRALEGMVTALECAVNSFSLAPEGPGRAALTPGKY